MTADAFGTHQTGSAGLLIEDDGLMTAVAARHLAAATADTQFLVELRINDGVAVQMVGVQELLQPFAHEFTEPGDTALGHIALQTEYEVVDDAIAILHHSRTYLHVATAQLDEFQGIAPRLNATNTTQFKLCIMHCALCIISHLGKF